MSKEMKPLKNDGAVALGDIETAFQKPNDFVYTPTEIGCVSKEGELGHWNLWRGAIAEFFATMMFLFVTLGTVASTGGYADIAHPGTGLGGARHWLISTTFGSMISILVYCTAPISGGNINPAVSIALACTRKISPLRCVIYIISQCLGASAGAALVKGVNHDAYMNMGGAINSITQASVVVNSMGKTVYLPGYTVGGALLGEIICTCLLVFCVMSAVDANNAHADRANMKQSLGVMCIGLCVTMAHCVLIPVTNCSINPARSFGASLVYGEFPDHWVFWVGPILGGLFAAFFYELILKDRPLIKKV